MMTTDQIRALLVQSFNVARLEILDDSHRHAGHKGARESGGGHYSVLIVSDDFEGKTLVTRHRMVYQALSLIKEKIHALGIKACTIDEFENSGS